VHDEFLQHEPLVDDAALRQHHQLPASVRLQLHDQNLEVEQLAIALHKLTVVHGILDFGHALLLSLVDR